MTRYGLYGLRLESSLEFPQLPVRAGDSESQPDVFLSVEPLTSPRPSGVTKPDWFGTANGAAWFDWRDVGLVRICAGRTIQIDPIEGVDPAGLRTALLGPAFTVLLAQRGLYPLHASAVAVGGRAVAFAADSGMGKSTLALFLSRAGHAFLADDVCALEVEQDSAVRLRPGFPQLKLEPELLAELGEDWESMPRVHPEGDKRARPHTGDFPFEGLPLDRVFILQEGPPRIEGPLPIREAFLEAQRFGHRAALLARAVGAAVVMERSARLASGVPFYRLSRPSDLGRLEEVRRTVEAALRA